MHIHIHQWHCVLFIASSQLASLSLSLSLSSTQVAFHSLVLSSFPFAYLIRKVKFISLHHEQIIHLAHHQGICSLQLIAFVVVHSLIFAFVLVF